jgi:hypothetical protein
MSPKSKSRRGKASPKTSKQNKNTPIQIRSNVELSHRYRFTSNNGGTTGITPTSMLCAAGTMGTVANTTVTSVFGAVKLNRIEIWSPPASQGSTVTCSVDFVGLGNSPNREYSDTSISVTTPAHITCSPPPQSLASFWQFPSTTSLCNVTAPIGSIIDVVVSLIMNDQDITPATTSVATAVLGSMYFLSLDPNTTKHYPPVSLSTTS